MFVTINELNDVLYRLPVDTMNDKGRLFVRVQVREKLLPIGNDPGAIETTISRNIVFFKRNGDWGLEV